MAGGWIENTKGHVQEDRQKNELNLGLSTALKGSELQRQYRRVEVARVSHVGNMEVGYMSLKFELTFVLIFGAVASWRADEVKL